LRQVLYQYVPQSLIDRPKMGFGTPVDQWLRTSLRDWAESLLDETRIQQEGFFDAKLVREKWNEHLSGERYWGVRDHRTLDSYCKNLEGVWNVIPLLLKQFNEHDIHATWATVGFLFFEGDNQLRSFIEKGGLTASYDDKKLSPYYCLESGQSYEEFEEDTRLASILASEFGVKFKSLVFPRNQCNRSYFDILTKYGINSYRGNENHWMNAASNRGGQNFIRRGLRLIDTYLNISGHHTYTLNNCVDGKLYNFRSSRILRPYSRRLASLEKMKLRRIKKSMTYAAKHNEIYHLWWHPHNFGVNLEKNMLMLTEIIRHFKDLQNRYGMQTLHMSELSELVANNEK